MKLTIEIDTDTNIPFDLDISSLEEWFEDQVNMQIGSMVNQNIEYASPTVKVLENNS